MDNISKLIGDWVHQYPILLGWVGNLTAALCLLIVGLIFGRWVRKRIRNSALGGEHLDPTLKPVLASVLFYIIIAMTLYAVLIRIGVPPTSLIAIFGAAGLAIGLSLKDTLSNIAAGIMILLLRPLEVGEFVELSCCSGTIREVGLFATTLKTSDGIYQYIPNSNIWDSRITNYGRHSIRRLSVNIGVGYETDLRKAKALILDILNTASDAVIDAPAPEAQVVNFAPYNIEITARVWLTAEGWGEKASELRIQVFEALKAAGIEIPAAPLVLTPNRST